MLVEPKASARGEILLMLKQSQLLSPRPLTKVEINNTGKRFLRAISLNRTVKAKARYSNVIFALILTDLLKTSIQISAEYSFVMRG